MIVLSRIDSRLVHGQVIEAWLPHLKVKRLVVADDEAAGDPLARTAMGLAVPPEVKMVLSPVGAVDFASLASDAVPTLVLFRDVAAAVQACAHGLPVGLLQLGNLHSGPGRTEVSRSVHLSSADRVALGQLERDGMQVRIQAVPSEKASEVPLERH